MVPVDTTAECEARTRRGPPRWPPGFRQPGGAAFRPASGRPPPTCSVTASPPPGTPWTCALSTTCSRIDAERMTADVEGMITYEALVEETLRYGLLPAVVPQLKTITVGGAVSGLGIESSSFKYGLVHETVEAMEILTGNGDIVACSARRNPDLFFGFPNSYGTLGYALRLTIRLVPAAPYVYLTHTRFRAPDSFFAHLAQVCARAPPTLWTPPSSAGTRCMSRRRSSPTARPR
jgi:hypothetical protein